MLGLKTLEHIFLNQEQKLNLLVFLRWTNQYHFCFGKAWSIKSYRTTIKFKQRYLTEHMQCYIDDIGELQMM